MGRHQYVELGGHERWQRLSHDRFGWSSGNQNAKRRLRAAIAEVEERDAEPLRLVGEIVGDAGAR
jgi:hypothetical protein